MSTDSTPNLPPATPEKPLPGTRERGAGSPSGPPPPLCPEGPPGSPTGLPAGCTTGCSELPEPTIGKLWVILMVTLFLGHLVRNSWIGHTGPVAAFLPALAMLFLVFGDVWRASGSLRPLACHDETGRQRIIRLSWVSIFFGGSLLVPTFGPQDPSPGLTPEVFLGMGLLVPIAEEFFFRGALLGWLRARTDDTEAVLLTSLCFAGLHAVGSDPSRFLATFGLGLGTGVLAIWNRCLHPAILLHAFYNLFQLTGGWSGRLLVSPFPILMAGLCGTFLLTAHSVRVRPHPED